MILRDILQDVRAQDTIVHIGPGVLYNAIQYHSLKAALIIIEPDEGIFLSLARVLRDKKKHNLINKALVTDSDAARLYRYNFQTLNSTRVETNLRTLFPGLVLEEARAVPLFSIDELVGLLGKKESQRDVLVIDCLGAAYSILLALDAANMLSRFYQVIIRAPRSDLYGESAPLDDSVNYLIDRQYDMPVYLDRSDPEFPVIHMKKSALIEDLDEVKNKHEALHDLQQATKADLQELQERFASLHSEKQKQDCLLNDVTTLLQGLKKQAKTIETQSDDGIPEASDDGNG